MQYWSVAFCSACTHTRTHAHTPQLDSMIMFQNARRGVKGTVHLKMKNTANFFPGSCSFSGLLRPGVSRKRFQAPESAGSSPNLKNDSSYKGTRSRH